MEEAALPDPTQEVIFIKGARENNLKNLTLAIPRNELVVVTGVSGSGKSSLAFDTLFAEGQRRYVESLSSYARQFLGRIKKPDVDRIVGIPPAIAIEQKVTTRNPRSTLGTSTEIYDYLRLLYARVGRTYSPISGNEVRCHHQEDVLAYLLSLPQDAYALVVAPIGWEDAAHRTETLLRLQEEGYVRFYDGFTPVRGEELLQRKDVYAGRDVRLLLSRLTSEDTPNNRARITEAVKTALEVGNGCLQVVTPEGTRAFSTRFEADGMTFLPPTEYLFSFNNPMGACPHCSGAGWVVGVDEQLVIPNPALSVYKDAVACWRGEVMGRYKDEFVLAAHRHNFPIHKPYNELTPSQKDLLWHGAGDFTGIMPFFEMLEKNGYKMQYRVLLSRYKGRTVCPHCGGTRLRPEAGYVKVGGKAIHELLILPVGELRTFFDAIAWTPYERQVAGRTILEISHRLQLLCDVGLSYLTLNRPSNTLSGGESQRVNLVSSLGSSLVGSLYILDEPSIGLHPRDTQRLLKTLKELRDLGNTVVVVEHDEEIMRAANTLIDIGPLSGSLGGQLVYLGPPPAQNVEASDAAARSAAAALAQAPESKTLQFLTNPRLIPVPQKRRKWNTYIDLEGVQHHNLKDVSVRLPLQVFTAVTGVSGSGKSSLVRDVLYPALYRELNEYGGPKPGAFRSLTIASNRIGHVEMVDQNPIGRSSRSNPVTYIKAYDDIRHLFSQQPYAKLNGYGHAHFSFNIDGGRCPECQGEGIVKVEMQFMADVTLTCESCGGKRFIPDVLEVRYKDKNISDVLDMTVDKAIAFFASQSDPLARRVAVKLAPLAQVGLGYIKLGQNSSTLSGGESQRVKLASFLAKEGGQKPTLFIFDEPTTGLHAYDIAQLLEAFNALLARGHSVVVVEHNMDVVKCADWVIDLGPEAGEGGGTVCFAGTPEALATQTHLPTGAALAVKLAAK